MKYMVKELRIEKGNATEVQNFKFLVSIVKRGSFVCLPSFLTSYDQTDPHSVFPLRTITRESFVK